MVPPMSAWLASRLRKDNRKHGRVAVLSAITGPQILHRISESAVLTCGQATRASRVCDCHQHFGPRSAVSAAAMGLDSMRGTHGRCPPLLVGGLLVVAFIMTCNWWSSSTQNMELLKQLDELAEQLRRCNDDKDQSMQLRLSVEGRLKSTEEELAQLRVRLEQQDINADDTRKSLQDKDAEIGTLKTAAEAAKNAAKLCTTELESLKKVSQSQEEVIKSLKIEKDELAKQKEERRKDAEKLKTDLEKVTSELNNLKASQPAPGTPNVAAKVAPASAANTKSKAADLNADEKDEDNAKEREDPINNNEAVDAAAADDERFDNKNTNDEADNNNLPDANPAEDSVDQMAQAIQQDNNNGGGVAPAPPAKP